MIDASPPNPSTDTPTGDGGAGGFPQQPKFTGELTSEQMQILASDAVARGQITRAEADTYLAADGLAPLPAEPATPAEAVAQQIDRAFPPATAAQFDMPKVHKDGYDLIDPTRKLSDTDIAQLDGTAREWMAEARLPAPIGSAIAKAAVDHVKAYPDWATMPEAQRQIVHATTMSRLQSMWGDKTDAMINGARRLIQELDARKPGVAAFLERTGIGNDVGVIAHLANHAARLAARRG